jgi:hypothetical protein
MKRITRLLGGEREFLAADKRVEQRRLADVGAADERELWPAILGAVIGAHAALDEIRVNHLRVASRVRAQHDVGALEDPRGHALLVPRGHLRPRRQEEPVEGELYLHIPQGLFGIELVFGLFGSEVVFGLFGVGVVYYGLGVRELAERSGARQ